VLRPSDFVKAPAEASVFHGLASAFLAEQGFALLNDVSEKQGRFNFSVARYRSSAGLYISVRFDPGDTDTADVICMRECAVGAEIEPIFCSYSLLARHFGLEVPRFYKLEYGDQQKHTMNAILADLKRTLPHIASRATAEDFLALERLKV
jgi:hypothetical protein